MKEKNDNDNNNGVCLVLGAVLQTVLCKVTHNSKHSLRQYSSLAHIIQGKN